MPNQPKTPARSVRVGADLWNATRQRATHDGTTVTAIIIAALTAYTHTPCMSIACATRNHHDCRMPPIPPHTQCACICHRHTAAALTA